MTRARTPQSTAMVRRILRHYDRATDEQRAEGERWYEATRLVAIAMADGTRVTPEQAAGIVAALSPRTQWTANVRAARRIVQAALIGEREPRVAGTLSNRRKAWRIACGEQPSAVLSGPKVCAFYRNIIGDDTAVTVDVWAARAAGIVAEPRGKRYEAIADAYRRAAELRSVTPRVMQATVWCAVRGNGSTVSMAEGI